MTDYTIDSVSLGTVLYKLPEWVTPGASLIVSGLAFSPIYDGRYSLEDYVYIGGLPAPNIDVFLFDRLTKLVIRRTTTDANGLFRFDNLPKPSTGLFAIAFDAVGPSMQNAGITDFMEPV
jgi:hypothetical protein